MSNPPAFNPYAPPKTTDFLAATTDQVSYDGKVLKVPKNFTFPPVCIKTGAAEHLTPPRRRKLAWHSPLLLLLLIINILIFAIVAACVSKKGTIYFQLSGEIARKRRNAMLRNWALFLASIILSCMGIGANDGALIAAGLVTLLLTIILAVSASRFLWAKRVDKTHIWLCGVSDSVARAMVATQGRAISV